MQTYRIIAVTAILLGASAPALAESANERLFSHVYADGGNTLYCRSAFAAGASTQIDRLYPDRQLEQHFRCSNSITCRRTDGYLAARDDLHQMFPIERRADLDRRGALIGETRTDNTANACGYRLTFQTFEPPDHAKGDVARAMLYMHTQHGLPLVGTLEMYQRWNELDPPDEMERARNDRIEAVQGRRNPYIDAPEMVKEITLTLPDLF